MKHRLMLTLFLVCYAIGMGMAQERKVPFNGRLTDFDGERIKKARIYVSSPKRYVTCNKAGDFGLTNVDTSDTLKIEVNKQTYRVPIENRQSIVICLDITTGETLAREDAALYERGFDHVTSREQYMGNIISGRTIRRSGCNNLFDALKGRVPGLNITTDGRPGGESDVNIRGVRSLMLSSTPLFVVDGMVTESISDISIHNIEYVEIMKDAYIFGARGANGAILVFTRR